MRKLELIDISEIAYQDDRVNGGQGDIGILAESIDSIGLQTPVQVYKTGKNYRLITGRRRLEAVKRLEWKTIPAIVEDMTTAGNAEEISLSENVNRLPMNPLDEAAVFSKLLETETVKDVARRYDRKVPDIYQRVRLLDLTPEIQAMFREGRIRLHTAAMLSGFNKETLEKFYELHKKDRAVEDWEIYQFMRELKYDLLYDFLADKNCAGCKTRTRFGDKTLFPELDGDNDRCLNHECYLGKIIKLLETRLKDAGKEHPGHAGALILVDNTGQLKNILGKSARINGADYEIKPYQYTNILEKEDGGAAPCWLVSITDTDFRPGYWKEKKEKKSRKENPYAPAVKLLGLPRAEARETAEALKANKKLESCNFNNTARKKAFLKITERKAAAEPAGNEVENFLRDKIFSHDKEHGKKIFEYFIGSGYSKEPEENVKTAAALPREKLFALMYAFQTNEYEVPPLDNIKNCDFLRWAGLSPDEAKELYREAVKESIAEAGKKKNGQ
ncbi:MAG: ParB/RepB/Spo0J family partition protein [Treponema sp.]|jgi:ParB/RepB/Spo0J family partition protein|nr:ParB/RepB/Spo0J family partition protein [Treponema sp.]